VGRIPQPPRKRTHRQPVTYPQSVVRRVLGRSDERDRYIARILAAERAGYQRGLADGREQGARAALYGAPLDVDPPKPWPTAISPEVDRRRYPPHGRKRFGEARPGDYPGRGA
jgi:hypothetical protein